MDYKQTFALWETSLQGTEYESALLKLGADEKLKEDSFYQYLAFGTAGMRGILGPGTNRMNSFMVRRSTKGLADYVNKKGGAARGVAIAYDSRHMSREFARETALVLCKNGIKTYLYDTLKSVPQLSFAVLELNCFAGVVITASHNPPQYNGYKVYGEDGGQLAPAAAEELTGYINAVSDYFQIETALWDEALSSGLLTLLGSEMDERYYARVKTVRIDLEAPRRAADRLVVVYTPLHGSGNIPVRRLLLDLGIKQLYVVPEQEKPDGAFPTVKAPNPEERDAFDLAFRLADEKNANLIIATDPDCDRMGVAVRDKAGKFLVLSGNQIGCLLMDYILRAKQKSFRGDEFVVKSVVSTPMADVIAAHYGVHMRQVLTGFRFIAEQIKLAEATGKGRFLFGFEESYGFLCGTFVRDKDAAMASMMLAEAACHYALKGMTLYDALEALYQQFGYYREAGLSLTLSGIEGLSKIASAMKNLAKEPPKQVGAFDVTAVYDYEKEICTDCETGKRLPTGLPKANMLRFALAGGSLILRPSGTEPKLKAYCAVSGKSEAEAEQLLGALKNAAEALLAEATR